MAQLTYNSINKFRYYGRDNEEEDEIRQEETLRDKLLKKIISSHLKTNYPAEDCIKNKEKFILSTKQEGFSKASEGLMTNEAFKNLCKEADLKELLLSCDLEAREIDILLDDEFKLDKGTEEAFEERLKNIEQKLALRQIHLEDTSHEQFSGAVKLNRHEYEEECNKICSSEAEKLTSCLVQLEPYSDPALPADHPLNKLAEMEKRLFSEPGNGKYERKKTKKRKLNNDELSSVVYLNKKPNSYWDMKERPVILSDSGNREYIDKCETPIQYRNESKTESNIDYSKAFIWSLNSGNLLLLSVIEKNRQTIEEIKSDPKFQNYNQGTPSPTLYVKNLPHKMAPISLVSLFGNFEQENVSKIEYRILKGKMQGQAFVKFTSEEVARKAFELCNGYILDGKPIVIEYGRLTR